jgi:hypothetical protein
MVLEMRVLSVRTAGLCHGEAKAAGLLIYCEAGDL